MDELTIGDKTYISSKKAAQITGYAKDYVGQLCREGHVDAKMVGRNWYVLEASIRAHRFGNETKSDQPVAEEGMVAGANPLRPSWEAPSYEPEAAPGIPQLTPRPAVVAERPMFETATRVAPQEDAEEMLTDMQAAWKEWFARKEQTSDMTISEAVDSDEAEEEPVEVETEQQDAVPVPFHTVEEEPVSEPVEEDAPEPVQITRTHHVEPEMVTRETPVAVYKSPSQEEDDGVYVREYRSNKRVKMRNSVSTTPQDTYLLVKTALIAVMLLSVSVAVLGSGMGDAYTNKAGVQYAAIQFLNGTSVYQAK